MHSFVLNSSYFCCYYEFPRFLSSSYFLLFHFYLSLNNAFHHFFYCFIHASSSFFFFSILRCFPFYLVYRFSLLPLPGSILYFLFIYSNIHFLLNINFFLIHFLLPISLTILFIKFSIFPDPFLFFPLFLYIAVSLHIQCALAVLSTLLHFFFLFLIIFLVYSFFYFAFNISLCLLPPSLACPSIRFLVAHTSSLPFSSLSFAPFLLIFIGIYL